MPVDGDHREHCEPEKPPVPDPPEEKPSVPPQDSNIDVARLLPASLGFARFFFAELWTRCGDRPGEMETTVKEMVGWNSEYTADKIRYYLKKLADPRFGYVIVENLSTRGRKRLLVNQPTRVVHEMPLFDHVHSVHGEHCELHSDHREHRESCGEPERPQPEKMPESPAIQAPHWLPPTESQVEDRRQQLLAALANREKIEFSHSQEKNDSLSIKNHQELKKSGNQESRTPARVTNSATVSLDSCRVSAEASKRASRPPPPRNCPVSAPGVVSLSETLSGAVTAVLRRPRKNDAGMRLRREEIVRFVESHWPPCLTDDDRKSRWVGARRVAVCAVDLDYLYQWDKNWQPNSLKAKNFGKYMHGFIADCIAKREMDFAAVDAIGREVFSEKKR